MLAPLTASTTFMVFGATKICSSGDAIVCPTGNIDLMQMNDIVCLSACVAGAVFFGWGFDCVRTRAY